MHPTLPPKGAKRNFTKSQRGGGAKVNYLGRVGSVMLTIT